MQTLKIFFLALFSIIPLLTSSLVYSNNLFNHPDTWKDPRILELLATSKVLNIEPMKKFLMAKGKKMEFEGDVFIVTLNTGIKAIFKNIPADDLGDAQVEIAAYQASLYLGFPYIPPTVMRKIHGMVGSLQLYIDTETDLLAAGEYKQAIQTIPIKDQIKLQTFYFIFGQWDSGPHNLLLFKDSQKSYFIAIDNAAIRNHQHVKFGELPFVRVAYSDKFNTNDWDDPFPFNKAEILEIPVEKSLKQRFGKQLPPNFLKNFKSYNFPVRFVIYRNSLWLQYHAFEQDFIKSFPRKCYPDIIETITKLDLPTLRKIFLSAQGSDFLSDSYLNSILERRDQLVKYCITANT